MASPYDTPDEETPVLIQSLRRRKRGAPTASVAAAAPAGTPAPLVLFHDAGGTIYNYFLLRSLGRDTFGFPELQAAKEESWTGGMRGIASRYVERMKAVIPPGPIILGGKFSSRLPPCRDCDW